MEKRECILRRRALMDEGERKDVLWWRKRFTDALLGDQVVQSAFNATPARPAAKETPC